MTTPEPPRYTSRTLPAPWVECAGCGSLALPDLDAYPRCPSCAARDRLVYVAEQHLDALLAPQLAAWGHHYAAQGLNMAQLYECLERWAGGWMSTQAQAAHLTARLIDAAREYPAPSFTPSLPERLQLDARTLPQVLAAHLDATQPAPGPGPGEIDRRLTFTVREADGHEGEYLHLSPGCDVLLILNVTPEGEALLYYLATPDRPGASREALRVPARLLPQVRAALSYWGTS